MVEATAPQSTSDRNQTTPESEKPRVQLELTSSTSPPVASKHMSNQQQHLDLLKQTVAHLAENQDSEVQMSAQNSTSASNLTESGASTEASDIKTAQHFETKYQELQAKVSELQKGTGHAADMSFEQRGDSLNDLFTGSLMPLVREMHGATIQAQIEEQLYYQQTLEYQNRGTKADIIRQKYEQITREYNDQNKQFQERHIQIKEDEQAKRQQTLKNFDDHLSTIRSQMAEDLAKSREENELIKKETADLETKREELEKECQEKMELMTKQLSEQGEKQENIETTLQTQIDTQAEEIKKQAEAYKEQTKNKIEEEKQLITVLKEYKAKFQEFQKATKFSKQNHKKFAKEVQQLSTRKKALEVEYESTQSQLGIQGPPEDLTELLEAAVADIAQIDQSWTAEKETQLAQVDKIKEECAQLQADLKAAKEAAAAAAK